MIRKNWVKTPFLSIKDQTDHFWSNFRKLVLIRKFLFRLSQWKPIFTARKGSLEKGNIFSSMCQEFCSLGGICLSACWYTTHHPQTREPLPPKQTPPWNRHPPDQAPPSEQTLHGPGTPQSRPPPDQAPHQSRHPRWTRHPPAQCMLGDMVNKWAVCILPECNLVLKKSVTRWSREAESLVLKHSILSICNIGDNLTDEIG